MAHKEQQQFCNKIKKLKLNHFIGKTVLDVGSLNINGHNRGLFSGCFYIGIDLQGGENVDVISSGHEFKPDILFDTIISTEALEHDKHYKETLQNLVKLLKGGGLLLITCATTGRAEHGTKRSRPEDSPFTLDYYRNLTEEDFRGAIEIDAIFKEYSFEINHSSKDLYFYGVKK